MSRVIAALGWIEFTCWLALVLVVLVVFRPAAIVVDLLAPHLRPLSPRAGHFDRRKTS